MQLSLRYILVIYAVLTCIEAATLKHKAYQCPIGFLFAQTHSGKGICFRQKAPETFSDKFKDCEGNLYSSKLYHSLNISHSNKVLWTEYKSLYPGGPFVDWSFTDSTGDLLLSTYNVTYDSSLGIDEELCVVIDPVSNFTAARCDEKHYRYCFVKPYPDDDDFSTKGCQDGSWRFYSPYSTCLTAVNGVGGGTVRATWRQALEMCYKRGASLLTNGWRYSNSPVLHTSGALPYYPMGIVKQEEHLYYQYDVDNISEIPSAEWNFQDTSEILHRDWDFGAIRDDFWRLVNNSFVFFDVICEQPLPLRYINLNLTVDRENNLMLMTNQTLKKNEIKCFSDSLAWYPRDIEGVISMYEDQAFQVVPAFDGYYWCIQMDYKNYHASESNKQLYIQSREDIVNLFAVKIRVRKEYRLQNIDKLKDTWKKKLSEYIFYSTKYISIYEELPTNGTEKILQNFKKTHAYLDWKDADVIYNLKIKRLYLDSKTALVHVMLNPTMKPSSPGSWGLVEVLAMRPAYICPQLDSVPQTQLGQSVTTSGCRTFTCIGDFNDGVQWVETSTSGCVTLPAVEDIATNLTMTLPPPPLTTTNRSSSLVQPSDEHANPGITIPRTENDTYHENNKTKYNCTVHHNCTEENRSSSSYEEIVDTTDEPTTETEWNFTTVNPPTLPETTEEPVTDPTTTEEPTTTTLPPDEQLRQVIGELQTLIDSETYVPLESIDRPFDQVNDILEMEDPDLVIPGELLHLLDELGTRVALDEGVGITVRANVAILMADSNPQMPVRGIRVATREKDAFSNDTFGFIEGSLDNNQLLTNESEALVYLPASVSAESRRISFVAFRNQRAFPSDLPVNSRIFSVNVENITHFENGEVIDIHLTPIVEVPGRNQSRACAYWKFIGEDSTGYGYWSQEGCQLIRSTTPGTMDTCRCDHLTHFAEVLISRTVFSERHEQALEVLTIIGCVISLIGLLLIGLTASMFRSWRRDYSNKIWLQLCIAIFVLVMCFLIVVFVDFDHYSVPCMLLGVALHYSVLASFCWMLVAAVLSYRRLVLVFTRDMSHKLLRASAFSWGTPCAIVGILLSVDPRSYRGQFEETTPNGAFCYPSGLGLWLAVYTPIAIMLLANWILFALIVRSVFASRRIQRHGDSNEALRCASVSCLLVFLFGLPWIFGLFAFNVVLAYLFTLTGTFQGLVLFIFFVLGNKKTRDLWLNKLKIKQTRKVPVTSSTYTNRSTGPGWRAGAEAPASIEAKTSKPRSLTSPDDSRFS